MSNLSGMWRRESRRILALLGMASALTAQEPARLDLGGAVLANGEAIRYLRMLALTDSVGGGAMTVQPFTARGEAPWLALAARTDHPWAARFSAADARSLTATRRWQGAEFALLRPDAQLHWRSLEPTTEVDGVIWAGKGATIAAQAGLRARWGILRAQFAPVVFTAQNDVFGLAPNGRSGAGVYRDSRFPNAIDLPQRFGDASYSRVDLGDSFVEASAFGLMLGISNARQQWGPSQQIPLVLGPGAGGFMHLQWGTAAPMRTPIGSFQLRGIGGKLEQSEYSPVQTGERSRFLTAIVLSYSPAFARSAEFGIARLANGPWPAQGLRPRDLLRPFEDIINDNVGDINENADNGFASVFLRVAPPGSGFEAYGELAREDFSGSPRWLALEPDDLASYSIGVARSRMIGSALQTLRAEIVNSEVAQAERAQRGFDRPIPPYRHGGTRQGLTNRGQLLGSREAYGGSAAVVSWERFTQDGRLSVAARRETLFDWLPALGATGGVPQAAVRLGLRAELMRFRDDADWSVLVAPSYTLNHNLQLGRDRFALDVQFRWRGL